MKRKYRFPVSQQANLLGLGWNRICDFTHSQQDRFEQERHLSLFFGTGGVDSYHWSYPLSGKSSSHGRFMAYFIHEALQAEGTIYEIYLKELNFSSQLEEVLATRLAEAEVVLVEFMAMHEDQFRFYARDLANGREVLYSPHDYLEEWRPPTRPRRDSCLLQILRVPLQSVNLDVAEAVILTTPTYFAGPELKSRSLTCIRLNPGGLSGLKLEKKMWSHARWNDFCVDMNLPSDNFIQALARWRDYLDVELESSFAFPCLLHELELRPFTINRLVADIGSSYIALPELEWVLETLWNEQPRIPLWGMTPRLLGRHLCTQTMIDEIVHGLKEKGTATLLPDHVLMARPLKHNPMEFTDRI